MEIIMWIIVMIITVMIVALIAYIVEILIFGPGVVCAFFEGLLGPDEESVEQKTKTKNQVSEPKGKTTVDMSEKH